MIDRREFLALGAAALAPASAPGGLMKAEFLLTRIGEVLQLPFAAKQLQVTNLTPYSVYVNFNGEIPTSSRHAWEIAAFQTELSAPINSGMVAYATTKNPEAPRLTAFDAVVGPAQQIKSEASAVDRQHLESYVISLATGGTGSQDSLIVPAGIVRKVTHLSIVGFVGAGSMSQLFVEVFDGSSAVYIFNQVSPVSDQVYDRAVGLPLIAPMRIRWGVNNMSAGGGTVSCGLAGFDLRSSQFAG